MPSRPCRPTPSPTSSHRGSPKASSRSSRRSITRVPLLLGDLQRRILVSSGGTTFLVDRLEKRGLVERQLCPSDRRARYAVLTAEGTALIGHIFPAHAESIRRAMSGLGLADQRAAITLLKTLGTEAEALPIEAL